MMNVAYKLLSCLTFTALLLFAPLLYAESYTVIDLGVLPGPYTYSTARGYIETFGLEDALSRLTQPALRTIDIDLTELARG
jgi:hypothetical protein